MLMSRAIVTIAALFIATAAVAQPKTLPLDKIVLPPGFAIELVASAEGARAMALGAKGTLFVGSNRPGKVYAIRLGSGMVSEIFTVASDLQLPVGVAFKDGALYVSAVDRILRFDDIENRLENPPKPVIVTDRLPKETHHGWKFIAFGPDGKIYVPVGAPCNVCEPDPNRYANIMRMNRDGSGLEVFARGVRNTVGFDWHPDDGSLWFTDNGRDMLGDDVPPDELNHAPKAGMNFGFPYCHGGTISDPEFGSKHACSEFTPPVQQLGPHVAALGMRFYTGTQFPAQYRNQIFIAEHGSWNRSSKIGYRITLVRLENGRAVAYEPFATGWLQGQSAWAVRPTYSSCRTVRRWYPTIRRAPSTASAIARRVERRRGQ
jgi:glucose/arabinose dehydrogenase